MDELRPFLDPKMAISASAAFGILAEMMKLTPPDNDIRPRIITPCGSGQYYCLSLIRQNHSIADFNLRTGRFRIHEGDFSCGRDWPEPNSYLLACMGAEYGIERISREIVTALGIEPKKEWSRFDGAAYRTFSILLARFAYEDGITIENGNREENWLPDWIHNVPEDWFDPSMDDSTLGQFWRIAYESSQRSVILDDEMAMLVGTTANVCIDRNTRAAADQLERFLRAEDSLQTHEAPQ